MENKQELAKRKESDVIQSKKCHLNGRVSTKKQWRMQLGVATDTHGKKEEDIRHIDDSCRGR
jgi:hypothetical protein